jgi:hypothetical protein
MAKARYFSGSVELSVPFPVKVATFKAIGGEFSRHNRYDGFKRLVGVAIDGDKATMPVTRTIFLKSNPSNHKCGSKCRHAKGHDCECECGGKFHGVGG